jgi:hypothetical protein
MNASDIQSELRQKIKSIKMYHEFENCKDVSHQ